MMCLTSALQDHLHTHTVPAAEDIVSGSIGLTVLTASSCGSALFFFFPQQSFFVLVSHKHTHTQKSLSTHTLTQESELSHIQLKPLCSQSPVLLKRSDLFVCLRH